MEKRATIECKAQSIFNESTWYAKRKKEREVLSMVHKRFRIVGFRNAQKPDGTNATMVVARLISTILSGATHSLNLKTGLAAHQKFATLSS